MEDFKNDLLVLSYSILLNRKIVDHIYFYSVQTQHLQNPFLGLFTKNSSKFRVPRISIDDDLFGKVSKLRSSVKFRTFTVNVVINYIFWLRYRLSDHIFQIYSIISKILKRTYICIYNIYIFFFCDP